MQVAKLLLTKKGTCFRYRWSLVNRYAPMEFRRDLGQRAFEKYKILLKKVRDLFRPEQEEESSLQALGAALFHLLIPKDLQPLLKKHEGTLLILGAELDFPWEILHDGEQFLGVKLAIGRLPASLDFEFDSSSLSVFEKVGKNQFQFLMVADPDDKKESFRREVDFLADNIPSHFSSQTLIGSQATFKNLSSLLSSENYAGVLLHVAADIKLNHLEHRVFPSVKLADTIHLNWDMLKKFPNKFIWLFLHLDAVEPEYILEYVKYYVENLYDHKLLGVITSFFPTFSRSSRRFIGYFYRHIFEGLPPGKALQQARLKFWESEPENPAWASFIFFGDPQLAIFKKLETHEELVSVRSLEGGEAETGTLSHEEGPDDVENSAKKSVNPQKTVESGIQGETALEYDFDLEQAIGIALMEAKNLRQDFIGTPHLFIGLTKCPGGVTRSLLESSGFDPKKVRDTIRYALGFGHASLDAKILPTQRCARALKKAEAIAREEEDHVVREKHLLMAILQSGEGLAFEVLKKMGADPKRLSEKLQKSSMLKSRDSQGGATPTIDRYGRDLTLLAERGELSHLTGRSEEIMRLAQILLRRFKNNPLIIGEAGIGKTALVEGVAQRIVAGAVPKELQNCRLVELSLSSLVAGTRYRGDFEERLTMVIKEAQEHPELILFLDEFHTVVGAGETHQGTLDAANILKPALARGELRCIGATTPVEYRKYIEKDAALARRFHPLFLSEPTPEESFEILKGSRVGYEEHHNVTIPDEVLQLAVDLAARYLPDRRLPDKAFDLVDEACALVNLRGSSTPILTPDGKLLPMTGKPTVSEESIYQVLADWTGIPIGELSREESKRLLGLENRLSKVVFGQERAVSTISQVLQIGRAGLKRLGKPTAVLLFIGPSGVGKTELCRALAKELFGQESAMIRLDMSEFAEKNSTAKLIGAPPGYVGYGEEGQILSQLHHRPYSVVLLDEIEKAHFEVLDLFLQLFEEGRLTDSLGRTIDGRHAVFIMTSNLLAERFQKRHFVGFQKTDSNELPDDDIIVELKKHFRPEFLNRIDETVLFRPLNKDVLLKIARKHFKELAERALEQNILLSCQEEALMKLVQDTEDPVLGARPLIRAIEEFVARPLSKKLLALKAASLLSSEHQVHIRFSIADDGSFELTERDSLKTPVFQRAIPSEDIL